MKKFTLMIVILLITIICSGCGQSKPTESQDDIVASKVVSFLTASAPAGNIEPTSTHTISPTETEIMIEPSQTPTITETVTPTTTDTEDLSDPAQMLGAPAWTYDFNGDSSPWDFDYTQAVFSTSNGYLNLIARANANWHSWYVSSPKLQNAYVEALVETTKCSGADRFGLAVRSDSDGQQFYFMAITCDGRWGFFRMAEDVNIFEILSFKTSELLIDNLNTPHRMGIYMDGNSFVLYIDGKEVGRTVDITLTNEGYTGFLIAFAETPGFTAKIDSLKYWNIP